MADIIVNALASIIITLQGINENIKLANKRLIKIILLLKEEK